MDMVRARGESNLQFNRSARFPQKKIDLSGDFLPQTAFRRTVQSAPKQLQSDCHKGANGASAASDISPHIGPMTRDQSSGMSW